MDKRYIKENALTAGFKLKRQPSGDMDLNPYVYAFADSLLDQRFSELEKENETNQHFLGELRELMRELEQERDQLNAQNAELKRQAIHVAAFMLIERFGLEDDRQEEIWRVKANKLDDAAKRTPAACLAELQFQTIEDLITEFNAEYYGEDLCQWLEQQAEKLRQQAQEPTK